MNSGSASTIRIAAAFASGMITSLHTTLAVGFVQQRVQLAAD
jgi:hypothetical protein